MSTHPELDRALSDWLEHELPPSAPDGLLSEAMAEIDRTSRRPSWRIPERWIPMPITLRLVVIPRAAMLLLLMGLLAIMATAVVSVGGPPDRLSAVVVPPPTGPAANGLIAYDSAGDIWVMNPDGTDPRRLTTSEAIEHSPVWSRDGTRLAYWSQDAEGSPSSLIVIDADGSDPTTIATDEAGRTPYFGLDWAPDGGHVVYSLGGEGDPQADERVYVAAVDGSGAAQVGDPDLVARKPSYSPDGTTIAFTGSRDATSPGPYPEQGTYLMSSDGSDVRRLTAADAEEEYEFYRAEWSPDGTKLATTFRGNVWIVAADGTDERNLTEFAQDALVPRWSPDGSRVMYVSLLDGADERIIPAEGGDAMLLPLTPQGGHTWSPDGRFVAVGDKVDGAEGLTIIDAVSGAVLTKVATPDVSGMSGFQYASWQRLAVEP
jgi:dipeptidyl aminopeptidase/acylaminoacyl peptidase